MGANRRLTLRFRCDLPARWRGTRASGEGRVIDLSAGGLFCACRGAPAPGDLVELAVELPGVEVALVAEVCFVGITRHGHGLGARVVAGAGDGQARWGAYYGLLAERTIELVPRSLHGYLRRRTARDGR